MLRLHTKGYGPKTQVTPRLPHHAQRGWALAFNRTQPVSSGRRIDPLLEHHAGQQCDLVASTSKAPRLPLIRGGWVR